MFLVLLAIDAAAVYELIDAAREGSGLLIATSIIVVVAATFLTAGLFVVNPNEAKVLQFFGDYAGTVKVPGLRWANPFYTKTRVSQRVRNFESAKLTV